MAKNTNVKETEAPVATISEIIEDAQSAKSVIHEVDSEFVKTDAGLKFPPHVHKCETCPNCGTTKVHCTRSERIGTARERYYRCQKCPAYWSTVHDVPKCDLSDKD